MGGFYILIGSILEKRPFFQADLAGLGKCRTGGFGRIGVYRVEKRENECVSYLQGADSPPLSQTFPDPA